MKRILSVLVPMLSAILLIPFLIGDAKGQLPTAKSKSVSGTLKSNEILKPFSIGDRGRETVDFEVQGAGRIEARAEWSGAAGTLALILNGPGQTGYYARQNGKSPLSLSFKVTEDHIARGKKWTLSVVNFGTGAAQGKVVIQVPAATAESGGGTGSSGKTAVKQTVQRPSRQAGATQSVAKSITVLWPNGGEELEVGDPYLFRWQSAGLGNSILSLELKGGPGTLTHILAYPSAETNSYEYRIKPDIKAGHYKFKVSKKDGSLQDMSDGTVNIVRPTLNLQCGMEEVREFVSDSEGMRSRIYVVAYNDGTAMLKDVMFSWIIEKDGYVHEQRSAGIETLYPDVKYRLEIFSVMNANGHFRATAILDPQNKQNEKESLRGDNKNTIKF
jgi:hypothetical protein